MRGRIHGDLLGGGIEIGMVVDSGNRFDRDALFTNHPNPKLVGVEYRRDDEKNVQEAEWEHTPDFGGLFFGSPVSIGFQVNKLLYGRMMTHREGTGDQVHKLVVSVPEYLGGDVVMEFDFPDLTTVADSCGLIEHKR
jgi:hypothetical protein